MATVRELVTILRFRSDNSGLERAKAGVDSLKRKIRSAGTTSTSVGAIMRRAFTPNMAAMAASTSQVTAGIGKIRASLGSLLGPLSSVAGAMAAAFSVGAIKDAADRMMNLDGRLRTITSTEQERYATEDKLFTLSQQNRQSLDSMGDLYYKVARSAKQMGVSQEDSMRVTDIVSKALSVGGASAQEASAAILQLGQALGSGVLQGDELHSLDENASLLMQHIAENMGVTIGDLKEMGSKGELTSKKVIDAILASGDAIDGEFGKMPVTIGQAQTQIGNGFDMLVLKIQRDSGIFSTIATSISQTFGEIYKDVSDFIDIWDKSSKGTDPEGLKKLEEAHPVLTAIVGVLQTIFNAMNQLGEATGIDNIFTKLILIAGAIMVVGGVIGVVSSVVGALAGVFSGLFGVVSGVFGFLIAAGGWAIPIVAAVAGAVLLIRDNFDLVMSIFEPGLQIMKVGLEQLAEAWQHLQPFIQAIIPGLELIAKIVGVVIVTAIGILLGVASVVFTAIAGLVNTVARALEKVAEFIHWCADGLSSLIGKAKEFLGMSSSFSAAGSGLERFAQNTVNTSNSTQVNSQYVFNVDGPQQATDIAHGLQFNPYG